MLPCTAATFAATTLDHSGPSSSARQTLERRSVCQVPALTAIAARPKPCFGFAHAAWGSLGEGPRPLGQQETCERIGALVAGWAAPSGLPRSKPFGAPGPRALRSHRAGDTRL
jgi:hypothetical protein